MRMAVPAAKRMLGRTEAAAAAASEESRAAGKGLELGGACNAKLCVRFQNSDNVRDFRFLKN
jgi:hypothetical protein